MTNHSKHDHSQNLFRRLLVLHALVLVGFSTFFAGEGFSGRSLHIKNNELNMSVNNNVSESRLETKLLLTNVDGAQGSNVSLWSSSSLGVSTDHRQSHEWRHEE